MLKHLSDRIGSLAPGVKASIALFVASIVTKGVSYLTTPFYTRLLSAEDFGHVSVFLVWQNVFGIVAMFCLMNGVFNNGMVDFPQKRDEYSFSILGLSNLITLVFGIIVLTLYPFLKEIIQLDLKYIILMFVLFLFQPAYNFWAARERYEYRWKSLVLWSVLLAITSPLVAILCIVLSKEGGELSARIFGGEIPMILIYAGFCFYIAKRSNFKIDISYWKFAFSFNLPLIPHYLSSLLLNSSDTLMISYLVGDTQTAYYSVAHSVSVIVTTIWAAVNASLIPYTYEKCKIGDYQSISKVTSPLLLMFALISLLVTLLAPEVLAILGTQAYSEAVYVIPAVIAGSFFQVQYFVYANVVYYYKRPKYVMIASVTATMLNLFLNYVFINEYGYIAAGYTSLFCYLLQAAIDFFAMRYVVGQNVYNMSFIVLLSVLVIIVCLLCNLIYDSSIVRYVIILSMLVSASIFRKKITLVFKYKM